MCVIDEMRKAIIDELRKIFDFEVFAGYPHPEMFEKVGYPLCAVFEGNVTLLELIEDGIPEEATDTSSRYAVFEAEVRFDIHLLDSERRRLEENTSRLILHFAGLPYLGDYRVGRITYRTEPPTPEEKREFERIFSLPLYGEITYEVETYKVEEVEYHGQIGEKVGEG